VEPAAALTLDDAQWTYFEAQFEIDKHSDWTKQRGPVSAFKNAVSNPLPMSVTTPLTAGSCSRSLTGAVEPECELAAERDLQQPQCVVGQAISDKLAVTLFGREALPGERANMVGHQLDRQIQEVCGVADAQLTCTRENKRHPQPHWVGQSTETSRHAGKLLLARLRGPKPNRVLSREEQKRITR
jgi:hypothetical protein